jgi:hypothetical protein
VGGRRSQQHRQPGAAGRPVTQGPVAGGATAAPGFPAIPGCRLIAVAGQGGMGTVYRAEQASPRRIVAVKVLSQAAASPEKLAAFHREAETIARLEHPNILPVYGFGEAGGRPYLVLRYLGGGNVAALTRSGKAPLEVAQAVRWVRAIAGALDFAHTHGLVHRDVKPSNMLLDEAGNVYLTDFGIATASEAINTDGEGRAGGGEGRAGGGGGVLGSAAYMSPEQGSGQPAGPRSDIYSLAVSLFEMLTGQTPYTAETPLGVIVRHINDPIPSARALNPQVSPALDALIQRSMAKAPAARPQTAAEFARLLEQAAAAPADAAANAAPSRVAAPPTVLKPQPAAPAAPAAGRPSLLWLGVGLVALCLMGVLALGGGGALLAIFNAPRGTAVALATVTPIGAGAPTVAPTPPGQLLAANFADSLGGFRISKLDATGGVVYAGGALRFTVLKTGVEWFSPSRQVRAQDVAIDVDARQTAGPAQTEFGAICRWQDANNFTAFAISAGGQYKIWQKSQGTVRRLVDWTDASSLAGGGLSAHHLTITCSGTQLSLAVDGIAVGHADDPGPVPGDVVLFAGLREDGKLVVDFTKITATKP